MISGESISIKILTEKINKGRIRSSLEDSYLKAPLNCGLTQCGWVSLEVRWLGDLQGGGGIHVNMMKINSEGTY